jgi:excisionase family DNA binding protein
MLDIGTLQHQTAFPAPRGEASASPARRADRRTALSRVTLSIDEAAEALGISRDHLERHVLRDLRIVYTGRRRLIPVSELHRWAENHAVAPVATRGSH